MDAAARTSGATSRSLATMPWSSTRAARTAARSPACAAAARAATRSGVCRRRETPRAGSGSRIDAAEHGRPGRGRPPQHEPVTGRRGERGIEAQHGGCGAARELEGVATASTNDRLRGGRSEVDPEARSVRDGGGEHDEQSIRGVHVGVVREDDATVQAGCRVARKVERGAAAARNLLHRRAVDLDLADAHGVVARHDPQVRPARQRPAAERARDDRPATLDPERAIDGEAHRPSGQRHPAGIGQHPVAESHEPGPQLLDPLAGGPRHDHDRRPGERRGCEPCGDVLAHLAGPLRGHEIGLRDGHERVPDVQRVEQVEVLVGLGAEAVIGGHDEQGRIDLAGTRRACCRRAGRGRGRRRSPARSRRAA